MSTTQTKTISKSTKTRAYKPTFQPRQGANYVGKNSAQSQWKMIVEITEAGKNRKGKKIYTSKTRHVPA